MINTQQKKWLVISLMAALTACGGGGTGSGTSAPTPGPVACTGCQDGKINGTAATGAALANAVVTITDSLKASKTVSADSAGNYSVDVSGLKAPFLIQVAGMQGGKPVVYHSLATADDVGKKAVNITPLTEIMAAAVLGDSPATLMDKGTLDFAKVTTINISTAETIVETKLKAMLAAAGVGEFDLRTSEFTTNNQGIDLVFDAISVKIVDGKYQVGNVIDVSTITINPALPGAGDEIQAPSDLSTVEKANQNLSDIRSMLNSMSAKFADALPDASDLNEFFSDDFKTSGVGRDVFVSVGLLTEDAESGYTNIGFKFDQVTLLQIIDDNNVKISFRITPKNNFSPISVTMFMRKVAGKWLMRGDQELAGVRVYTMARLQEKPKTLSEIQALSNLESQEGTWEGASYTYYLRHFDYKGNSIQEWLGRDGATSFGVFGWTGDEYDNTTGDGLRALRRDTTKYYAQANGRVVQYMIFEVDSVLVDASVDSIVVTGPGLPSTGLPLTRPTAEAPRGYWIIKGDQFNWNAFNADRCAQMPLVANCSFDWTKVGAGSQYRFSLRNTSGNEVGVQTALLPKAPVNEDSVYSDRAKLFPMFDLDQSKHFTLANLYNDIDGPFKPNSTINLTWSTPTAPGSTLANVSFHYNYNEGALMSGVNGDKGEFYPTYGIKPMPISRVFTVSAPNVIKWAWATLVAYDAYGNRYEHEVSPANPY